MDRQYGAGVALGVGIGGSFDGIVFHQLLQWHHVVMTGPLSRQILTDGLFHTFAVGALLLGAYLLWQAHSLGRLLDDRTMQGSVLIGAGTFNLTEGLVNHHILQLHHVKPGGPDQLSWDLLFLAAGAVLVLWGLRQTGRERV
jgi:uncharacterized membrane protein